MNLNHAKRNVHKPVLFVLLVIALMTPLNIVWSARRQSERQTPMTKPGRRIRELGIKVGILPTGPLNAITDVGGVMVGQTTIIRGDDIRTGVNFLTTAIFFARKFRLPYLSETASAS